MPAMPNPPIRILLADDHKLTRDSWSMLLGYDLRFSVIHVSENGLDAIEKASLLLPDIVLVDINMYPVNGFTIIRRAIEIPLFQPMLVPFLFCRSMIKVFRQFHTAALTI